jgi:hypothetical protein
VSVSSTGVWSFNAQKSLMNSLFSHRGWKRRVLDRPARLRGIRTPLMIGVVWRMPKAYDQSGDQRDEREREFFSDFP